MKILHLPTSVGGNSWGLAQGERLLGLDSEVLVKGQHWLGYPNDINLGLENKSYIERNRILYQTFLDIRNQYDVFHFNYGSSLLDFQKAGLFLLDLPFYPENKKRIFTYNGSDIRQVHPLEYWPQLPQPPHSLYRQLTMRLKKIKAEKAARYADHIFALNPDLLNFLPSHATFLPYTIAGWNHIQVVERQISKKIKIVHSPTNREFKGSQYILKALSKLQKRYPLLEVQLIENIPYEQAIILYQSADIIIDQVLIGWYGAFGVEAMKMGIPLAVYIREEDLRFLPTEMARDLQHAVINVSPLNIETVLAEYIENPERLKQKAEAALEYVHRWHDPKYVASITKAVYES